MQFELTEKLKKRQLELREFLDVEIRPIADKRDAEGPLTKEEVKAFIQKLKPEGYVLSFFSKELGGLDHSYLERVIYAEELGRVWPSLAGTIDTHAGVSGLLAKIGGNEIRDKIVKPCLEGDMIACDMVSEPQAGSDTTQFKTTAILDGDHYVVNGAKIWQTNGPWADIGMIVAINDPEAYAKNPREGAINLFIEKSVSPWRVRNIPFIGLKAGTTGHMEFENCKVPKENLLTTEGYKETINARGWARVNIMAIGLGIMQAALEDSIAWVKKRTAFGKSIGGHQLIQEMIADMAIDLECSRFLTYRAAEYMDSNIRADLEQNMCKAFVSQAGMRVVEKAIQIHGGRGLTTEEGFRLERYYRDGIMGQIAEGTIQIVKLIVARRLLGIQAFF